jgi:hypothetical protein
VKKAISGLLLCVLMVSGSFPAYAEGQKTVSLVDQTQNSENSSPSQQTEGDEKKVIEVTMPDGTKQAGFIQDGQFIRLDGGKTTEVTEKNEEESELLINTYKVELTNPKLEKTLNRYYSAYRVVVENRGPNDVDVLNGDIVNGVDSQTAFETAKRNTGGRAIGWWLFTGAIGGGISAARNSSRNKATRSASMGYDKKLPSGPLPTGGQMEINTFVPIGATPQVKVVYRDSKSDKLLYAVK